MKHVITALLLFAACPLFAQVTSAPNNPDQSIAMYVSGNGRNAETMWIGANTGTGNLSDLNYRVLLGVFTHRIPIESDYWAAVRSDLSVTATANGYAYTIGYYKNYADALNMCKNLMRKGYQQATVATFTSDKVVDVIQP
ncbi:hypothetical protein C7N43_20930 [Sphingobacteriales bacterium UPWRP_1]|nr:hypothetical protein BVG80_15805 [Sphingobacteriales bacterium TSM_CSM]PSJ75048.1 hypothetical protein C7N43_20930 [Sphingobacteriales bacterium UPWRP_1]